MDIEINIIKGDSVYKLLKDEDFISKWNALATLQQNVTVQQEYPFVSTWYNQYANRFRPIIVLATASNSELVGLVPLAQDINNNQLTHAGAWQAEYRGWICKESFNEIFPIKALVSIKKEFNLKEWDWGWIPPRSNTNWLFSDRLKKNKIYIKSKEQDSPLMSLLDEERLNKIKKNKSTKNQLNRYTKRGDFFIERITSKERAEQIFDILEKQSDFRHIAIHNVAPFGNDSNKKPFHINRLEFKNSNHFTVLWSNNKPIAFNFGECDKETVFLGLTSYDPTESKNSPGKIFLIKLADFIKEEGYKYLDLTPGGDGYKDWFSNTSQKLYSPIIYFNKKNFAISNLKSVQKNIFKTLLNKLSLNPETFSSKIKIVSFKNLKEILSNIYNKKKYAYYKLESNPINSIKNSKDIIVKKNEYADLLRYNSKNKKVKKTTILSQALRRFNSDDILFTVINNDELIHSGWMTTKLKYQNLPEFDVHFSFPSQNAILYGFITEVDLNNQNALNTSIHQMIMECKSKKINNIFIGTFHDNNSFINIIEKIGFKKYQELEQTKLFWKIKNKLTV